MKGDIKFNKFKDSAFGEFLSGLKIVSKEIGFNMLCVMLTPKGGNIGLTKRQLLGFREKGYFDISVKNNKSFFRLTPKGKNLVELLKFALGKIKWDGRWRILIFDIPEREKYKRNFLRRKLHELGFKQLQESVWITPYPLPDSFSDFLIQLRVRPYLYCITVDAINRSDELKKYFNL